MKDTPRALYLVCHKLKECTGIDIPIYLLTFSASRSANEHMRAQIFFVSSSDVSIYLLSIVFSGDSTVVVARLYRGQHNSPFPFACRRLFTSGPGKRGNIMVCGVLKVE